MAQDEKIFADGFSFKRNEKAPDFVVGRLSINAEDGVAFIRQHEQAPKQVEPEEDGDELPF